MSPLALLCALLCAIRPVSAFPFGAGTCDATQSPSTFTYQGDSMVTRNFTTGWRIETSQNWYQPPDSVTTITLACDDAQGNHCTGGDGNFVGILLYVKNSQGDHVGTFANIPNALFKSGSVLDFSCVTVPPNTVTHWDSSTKSTSSSSWSWKAPAASEGLVSVMALVLTGIQGDINDQRWQLLTSGFLTVVTHAPTPPTNSPTKIPTRTPTRSPVRTRTPTAVMPPTSVATLFPNPTPGTSGDATLRPTPARDSTSRPTTRHTTRHPTARRPTARPTTRHHTTRHPTARPTARHPTARHPTARHPTTRHPTTRHPITRHPTPAADRTKAPTVGCRWVCN